MLATQYHFPVHYFVSQDPKSSLIQGRITKEKIIELVPDVKEREIFICGPVPMMKGLSNDLQSICIAKKHIHFEEFSL